jgi:hypothetical protein
MTDCSLIFGESPLCPHMSARCCGGERIFVRVCMYTCDLCCHGRPSRPRPRRPHPAASTPSTRRGAQHPRNAVDSRHRSFNTPSDAPSDARVDVAVPQVLESLESNRASNGGMGLSRTQAMRFMMEQHGAASPEDAGRTASYTGCRPRSPRAGRAAWPTEQHATHRSEPR